MSHSTKTESTKTESASAEDLRALLQEAEQALSDEASDRFDDLRERLRSALEDGRHSLERLRDEATRRARQADKLVRDNPYAAIGVAAGVGALIGIIVSRSCSSSR
ncbi:MAG TPA: hypothetical protein VGM73_17715 [Candidatus Didemnitutus sp.]|jgi:ElaB/YqjD/DUF883 family membrane-anchored ribosome-binding protein